MQQWSLNNFLQFLNLFLTPSNVIVCHIWLLLYLGGRGGERGREIRLVDRMGGKIGGVKERRGKGSREEERQEERGGK